MGMPEKPMFPSRPFGPHPRIFRCGSILRRLFANLLIIGGVLTHLNAADSNPPELLSATVDGTPYSVKLRFSEPVESGSAKDPAQYSLQDAEGNPVEVRGVRVAGNGTVVALTTDRLEENVVHTLTVFSEISDLEGNPISESNTAEFLAPAMSRGFVLREFYALEPGFKPRTDPEQPEPEGGLDGGSPADLANDPDFPVAPKHVCVNDQLELNDFSSGERFGARIRGYFIPKKDGLHTFYFASDDQGEFYFATDDDPANKVLVANEPQWNSRRNWTGTNRRPNRENISDPISLLAGNRYNFELLMKEGAGGDHAAVAVHAPGDPVPENGSAPISGSYLGVYIDNSEAFLSIDQQPEDQAVEVAVPATFAVSASASSPLCGADEILVQWQRNGEDIPGANEMTHTTSPTTPNDEGAVYQAVVSILGKQLVSDPAMLTVQGDPVNGTPGLIVYEGFDYEPGLFMMRGQSGGAGWNGRWESEFDASFLDAPGGSHIETPGLSYSDGVLDLDTTGNTARLDDANDWDARPLRGLYGGDGSTIYISFIAHSLYRDGFALYLGDTRQIFFGKIFNSEWGVSRTGTESDFVIDSAEFRPTLLVYRLQFSQGAVAVRMYVDPQLSVEPEVPTLKEVRYDGFLFDNVRMTMGSNRDDSKLDEFRIGTTYASVTPYVPPGAPLLAVKNAEKTEGDSESGTVDVPVYLLEPSEEVVTVEYSTMDQTASAGSDYDAAAGMLEFKPGETEKMVLVTIHGDIDSEANETLLMQLNDAVNAIISDSEGTITIRDDDPILAQDSFDYPTGNLAGNDGGLGWVGPWEDGRENNKFNFVTGNQNYATASHDLVTSGGGVGYAGRDGSTFRSLLRRYGEDGATVYLSFISRVTVDSYAGVSLFDGDSERYFVGQGHGLMQWTAAAPGPNGRIQTGVSAAENSFLVCRLDFADEKATGRLYVNPPLNAEPENPTGGPTSVDGFRFDRVRIASGPFYVEGYIDELRFGSSWAEVTPHTMVPPKISIAQGGAIEEGDTENRELQFEVFLSRPDNQPIQVDYTTIDDTAVAGSDYTATSGTLIFEPGETVKSIFVPVHADEEPEENELLSVQLSNPVDAEIETAEAPAAILDDDTPPTIVVLPGRTLEGDNGTTEADFAVSLTRSWDEPVTVDYASEDGTATAGADYDAVNGTLTFAPGETRTAINVPIFGDLEEEAHETFTLRYANPQNGILNSEIAPGLIGDEDGEVSIGEVNIIVAVDDPVPKEEGRFFRSFHGHPLANDYDEIAFVATTDNANNTDPETGIWLQTVEGLLKLASDKIPVDGPQGPLRYLGDFELIQLTRLGQVLFTATGERQLNGNIQNQAFPTSTGVTWPVISIVSSTFTRIEVYGTETLCYIDDGEVKVIFPEESDWRTPFLRTVAEGKLIFQILDQIVKHDLNAPGNLDCLVKLMGNISNGGFVELCGENVVAKQKHEEVVKRVNALTEVALSTLGININIRESKPGNERQSFGRTAFASYASIDPIGAQLQNVVCERDEFFAVIDANFDGTRGSLLARELTDNEWIPLWLGGPGTIVDGLAVGGGYAAFHLEFGEPKGIHFVPAVAKEPVETTPVVVPFTSYPDLNGNEIRISDLEHVNLNRSGTFVGTSRGVGSEVEHILSIPNIRTDPTAVNVLLAIDDMAETDRGGYEIASLEMNPYEPAAADILSDLGRVGLKFSAETDNGLMSAIAFLQAGPMKPEDSPEIEATKRASVFDENADGLIGPDDNISYTVHIENIGNVDHSNVMFFDTPDGETDLVTGSVTASQGTVVDGNNGFDGMVSVDIGDLPAGAPPVIITLDVEIGGKLMGVASLFNQGEVFSDQLSDGLLTDDPDTPTLNGDPTESKIDPLDYGDVPDVVGVLPGGEEVPGYPAGFAAFQIIDDEARIGGLIDSEGGPWPDIAAHGDDDFGVDDEEGVTFDAPMEDLDIGLGMILSIPVLPAGVPVEGRVVVQIPVGEPYFLTGWIDFNRDGDWTDPGEQVLKQMVAAPQIVPHEIVFNAPDDVEGGLTFARYRLNKGFAASPDGTGEEGEIEDYLLRLLTDFDFGDAPDGADEPNYATTLDHNGARHSISTTGPRLGDKIDADPADQQNADATADDIDDLGDDEDGIQFITPLIPGESTQIIAKASMTARLDAWIDFNRDGDWQDAGEQIFDTLALEMGDNELEFAVPADALRAPTFARFRISRNGQLEPFGFAPDGEVEDYMVRIADAVFQKVSIVGDTLQLEWSGDAVLQKADVVTGPWTEISDATSPYSMKMEKTAAYFRLVRR